MSETPIDLESSVEFQTLQTSQDSHFLPHCPPEVEVPEEKVKLDLIRLINSHFSRLEDQLNDQCGRLHTLVSNELDSLYAVAARWECFKSMEMEDIVRYIYGIVTANSETKILSQKSEGVQLPYNQ